MGWLRGLGLALGVGAALSGCAASPPMAHDKPDLWTVEFSALDGWAEDDHREALAVFVKTCEKGGAGDPALGVTAEDWAAICAEAAQLPPELARQFFETRFRPVEIPAADAQAHFTAYYEPELTGARAPLGDFIHPILARPEDLPSDGSYYWTRGQIEAGALDGKGLELFWLNDPVDAFYLHIQGSGRIRLEDGTVHRVGYAGKNGHPYVSVGKLMLADGVLPNGDGSAQAIREWVRANPQKGREYLNRNPSYIFFRELDLDPALGPLGSLGVPLTPLRSAAVDGSVYPLGAPLWIEVATPVGALRRLVVAQDTGSAIKGPGRVDLFFGSGAEAGEAAGRMNGPGRVVALAPKPAEIRVARAK